MAKSKRSLKKALAVLMAAALAIASMWCITAFAAGNVQYIDANGNTQTVAEGEYTSVTAEDTEWTTGTYVVDSNVTVSSRIAVSGNVVLILEDGKTLNAENGGISVGKGQSLTICAQSQGTGTLLAKSNSNTTFGSAAIGGDDGSNLSGYTRFKGGNGNPDDAVFGTIVINGGNITATADKSRGAAIGSGYYGDGNEGSITINGGNITADASTSNYAAGIGTASLSSSSDTADGGSAKITINSGTINAKGGSEGAGIGGGKYDHGYTITITGGNITASSESYGAGIGGGGYAPGGTITISGGYINATGTNGGAAIGEGNQAEQKSYAKNGTNITIGGGTVIATVTGSSSANGIGAAYTANGIVDKANAVSFSTGTNGCAVIYAKSIIGSDTTSGWSGLISASDIDGPAIVYGSPLTITLAEEIPSDKTAYIEANKTLTINSSASLTNYGTLYQDYGSTFNKNEAYNYINNTYYEVKTSDASGIKTIGTSTWNYNNKLYALENATVVGSNVYNFTCATYQKTNNIAVTNLTFTMPSEPVLLTDVVADYVTIEKKWKDVNGAEITGTATASCPNVSVGLFMVTDAEGNISQDGENYYYTSSSGETYQIGEDYYARDKKENIVAYYNYEDSTSSLYVLVNVLDTFATVFQNPVTLFYYSSDTENYGWVYTWDMLDSSYSYAVLELTESKTFEAGTPALISSTEDNGCTYYTWQVENTLTEEVSATENLVNIYVYDGTEIESPESAPLSGAGFILSKVELVEGEEVTYYAYCTQGADGYWEVAGWIAADSEYAEYATIFTSDESGYIRFSNIDSGTYILTEVTAPAGYLLPVDSIAFTVDVSGAVTSNDVKIFEDGITIPVANVMGSEMPLTGGTGTIMYTMVGLLLVVCAVYLLYRRKRAEGGIKQRE